MKESVEEELMITLDEDQEERGEDNETILIR